ncbi:MAG TPA: T9SS type A sorting domain-containing protein, partial [Chitinophagales bacterium]|nr:T9SS type A sorting domain-containing protein [Chitinophagales bacterium]HRK29369.1 T9SS type A sorting domain-containing protein [Chitinophagales bacterium]
IEDYNPTPPPPGGLDLPRGGSIIIIENQSIFENNLTGVLMNPYRPDPTAKYVQRSSIKDSYFQNNQAFISPAYPEYKYQLYLNSVNRVPIEGNLFSANPATLSLQNKGIGIKTVNSGINITENTFLDLYKGIDVYNTLTSVSVTNLEHNTFTEVNKALTLNYVPYAVVSNNTFNVPTGTNSPHDTYGLYTLKSFGFLLTGNTFVTTALANNHTRAVVLNQTLFDQAAIAQIRQNTFTGGFIDATRFEDNCRSLQLNCNVYLNEPQRDWYIAPDAELDKQGQCHPIFTELSFHQHWHYLPPVLYSGYSNYHVYNANPGFTLEIYHDDYQYSVPTYNGGSGSVIQINCFPGTETNNPSCTLSVPPYYGGVNEGCAYSGEELSRKIQDWQRAGETDSIIALLHCIAEDWSYKILVGTYIDRRMYPQALTALDSIPNTPQGNADFKAIYYAYIELLTGGSGKNADAAFALQQAEQNRTHAQQTLAESMFALLYGNNYLRTVQDNAANNTHFLSKPTFILAPNPANNSTAIYWHNALVVSSDVYITDITGRIVKTYHNLQNGQQINTDNLPNGIYYVHAAALFATQKLVVVH